MARLLTKLQQTEQRVIGRFSDGSDRQVIEQPVWSVEVVSDDGVQHTVRFDHDPTDQEVISALGTGRDLVPTTKGDLERYMRGTYDDWARWKATRIEAQARSLPGPVVSALETREDAAWTDYAAAINAWRTAP